MKQIIKNSLSGLVFLAIIVGFPLTSFGQETEKPEKKSKEEIQDSKITKVKMSIEGMSCMSCVANVKNTIKSLEGVKEVEVSLKEKQAIVTFLTASIEPEKIQEAVNKKGYRAGKPQQQKQ